MKTGIGVTFLVVLTAVSHAAPGSKGVSFTLVTNYVSSTGVGTEIISIQACTRRAVVANSIAGAIDLLDLNVPGAPESFTTFSLGLAPGEELTSVAFHPEEDYFAVSIIAADPLAPGRVELRRASTGALLKSVPTGVGPDSVVIDPTGRRAVVADEAERFVYSGGVFFTAPGSVTIVDLRNGAEAATAATLRLPDLTGLRGVTSAADLRFMERLVDWNGNGVIDTTPVDFNGDGDKTDANVVVGTFQGANVHAPNESGGEIFWIPLLNASPDLQEPEGIAITRNGKTAFVTMQEVNGVVVVDLAGNAIAGAYGLGTTTHAADLTNNGVTSFTQTLFALREPDGIALTHGGDYFVTADEGDTDPRANLVAAGKPAGGGRTLSVFNAATGQAVGDTGNGIDEVAAAAGRYPESRSRNKGSEPEGVIVVKVGSTEYAAVALERADAVALVSLANPARPAVLSVVGGGPLCRAPEGIASLKVEDEDATYVYTANETGGSVSVFRLAKGP